MGFKGKMLTRGVVSLANVFFGGILLADVSPLRCVGRLTCSPVLFCRLTCTEQSAGGKRSVLVSAAGGAQLSERVAELFGSRQLATLLPVTSAPPSDLTRAAFGLAASEPAEHVTVTVRRARSPACPVPAMIGLIRVRSQSGTVSSGSGSNELGLSLIQECNGKLPLCYSRVWHSSNCSLLCERKARGNLVD